MLHAWSSLDWRINYTITSFLFRIPTIGEQNIQAACSEFNVLAVADLFLFWLGRGYAAQQRHFFGLSGKPGLHGSRGETIATPRRESRLQRRTHT